MCCQYRWTSASASPRPGQCDSRRRCCWRPLPCLRPNTRKHHDCSPCARSACSLHSLRALCTTRLVLCILCTLHAVDCPVLSRGSLLIPPLLALAYALLGGFLPPLAMALVGGSPPSPRGAPGPTAALAVSSTVAIIKLSELLQQAELPPAAALFLLAVPCALQWRLLDGSRASLALASMLEAPSWWCRGSLPRPPGAGSPGSWRRHAPGAKGWAASIPNGRLRCSREGPAEVASHVCPLQLPG